MFEVLIWNIITQKDTTFTQSCIDANWNERWNLQIVKFSEAFHLKIYIFWIALAYQENGDSLNDCACIVNVITIHELVDIGKLFPSSRT